MTELTSGGKIEEKEKEDMHFARGNGAKQMERIFFRERTVWEDEAQAAEPVWNLSCREEKENNKRAGCLFDGLRSFIQKTSCTSSI